MSLNEYMPYYMSAGEKYNFSPAYFANLAGIESSHRNIPTGIDDPEGRPSSSYGLFQINRGLFGDLARDTGYTGTWEMFQEDPETQADLAGYWWGKHWNDPAMEGMEDADKARVLTHAWRSGTGGGTGDLIRRYQEGGGKYDAQGRESVNTFDRAMVRTLRDMGGEVQASRSYQPQQPQNVNTNSTRLAPVVGRPPAQSAEQTASNLREALGKNPPEEGFLGWIGGDSTGAQATRALGVLGAAGLMEFVSGGRGGRRYSGRMAQGGSMVDPYASAMAYRNRRERF